MENNKLLLTKQEAMDLLPFGRRGFESLIKEGELGFKKVNGRLYFSRADLERWVNNLEHHTDCTKEEMRIGHTSRSPMKKELGLGLEKLLELQTLEKLSNTATKGLRAYTKKKPEKPLMSFQV